jgi:hypothetical protein
LLDFLDIPLNKLIEKFIKGHTKVKSKHLRQEVYGTKKNSKNMAFKWRKSIENEDILKVQKSCAEPMKKLGYHLMTNIPVNKNDDSYPLLVKSSKDVWP